MSVNSYNMKYLSNVYIYIYLYIYSYAALIIIDIFCCSSCPHIFSPTFKITHFTCFCYYRVGLREPNIISVKSSNKTKNVIQIISIPLIKMTIIICRTLILQLMMSTMLFLYMVKRTCPQQP